MGWEDELTERVCRRVSEDASASLYLFGRGVGGLVCAPAKMATRKAKPAANSTSRQSRIRLPEINLDALARNIRYQQHARANETGNGDSVETARAKELPVWPGRREKP